MSTILNAWHDHEIETMKKMWLAGNSATEIARVLPSRSRNSVIAKVHRLGLTRERMEAKASPPASTGRAPAVKRNRTTGGIKIDKPAPASSFGRFAPSSPAEAAKKREHFAKHGAGIIDGFAEAANDTSILLIDRRRFQCSWPVGDVSGAKQMCCGQPVDPAATGATETYCLTHHKRAVGRVLAASKAFGFGERRQARRAESTPWDQGRAA
ncbi:GcrA family cell cycle regulator [Brevundimonas naejangsanensis]|uniref:GcrA family cell cycle regulator n=1 Tax=Brevundimonas naejangsanensis TaxID=588932 RepID=UPI0003FC9FCD|nr:GcrA family cell cycle regulator [Brevundimonas naejangsanensis]